MNESESFACTAQPRKEPLNLKGGCGVGSALISGGSGWPSLTSSSPLVKGRDWASSPGMSEFGNSTALGGKEMMMGMGFRTSP